MQCEGLNVWTSKRRCDQSGTNKCAGTEFNEKGARSTSPLEGKLLRRSNQKIYNRLRDSIWSFKLGYKGEFKKTSQCHKYIFIPVE